MCGWWNTRSKVHPVPAANHSSKNVHFFPFFETVLKGDVADGEPRCSTAIEQAVIGRIAPGGDRRQVPDP
jgi:hypothetical protein